MVEIAGRSSTTSRRPERMLTDHKQKRAFDCRVELTNGRIYHDWQMGLHGALFGYGPGWLKEALHAAVENGPISSIRHEDEKPVADALGEFYPDIEMLRFFQDGSAACGAAHKLSIALQELTAREKILCSGYHGTWPAFCTPPEVATRPGLPTIDMRRGTLKCEREAFVPLEWNGDIPDMKDIAAVILEVPPVTGRYAVHWLLHVTEIAREDKALVVLDEVVTGFRYGPGGAAEYFGLNERVDLYCFGKTLGNGEPIAAVAGKKEIVNELTAGVHASNTFNGNPYQLAAAKATLRQLREAPPWEHLYSVGEYLKEQWNGLSISYKLVGHPTRPIIDPDTVDDAFTDLRRHLFNRGHIWVDHPIYITTAHTRADVDALVRAAGEWER